MVTRAYQLINYSLYRENILNDNNTRDEILELLDSQTSGREQLDADRTYLVSNSVGSDTNSGIGASNELLTIAKALQLVEALDLNGFSVTIDVAPGNYTNEGVLHLPTLVGPKSETCFANDPVVPPNTQLLIKSTTGSGVICAGFEADQHGYYGVYELTFHAPDDGNPAIKSQRSSHIAVSSCEFAASDNIPSGRAAIEAIDGGQITIFNTIIINGGIQFGFTVRNGGVISGTFPATIEISANASDAGLLYQPFTLENGVIDIDDVPITNNSSLGNNYFANIALNNGTLQIDGVYTTTVAFRINSANGSGIFNNVYYGIQDYSNVPAYANDAAAGAAGLAAGRIYQTTGGGAAPLNVPGILLVKQAN